VQEHIAGHPLPDTGVINANYCTIAAVWRQRAIRAGSGNACRPESRSGPFTRGFAWTLRVLATPGQIPPDGGIWWR